MKQYFDIIKNASIWIISAFVMIGISIFLFFSNLNLSKDFTWWVEFSIQAQIDKNEIQKDLNQILKEQGFEKFDIYVEQKWNYTDVLIKINVSDDEKVSQLSKQINKLLLEKYVSNPENIVSFSVVGPSIGEYVKKSAILAIIWWLIFMSIYILFAFIEIKDYISPFLLSFITILTMIFDISIPAGAYGLLMGINSTVQVDVIFVIAILTIMGYSINDTIVIFDRIRENLKNLKEKWVKLNQKLYKEVFEKSLWQTMRRSLGTSISTFLVVLAMWIFGTTTIKLFAFTMWVGIIAWTFSSIFFAAPLAYILTKNRYK